MDVAMERILERIPAKPAWLRPTKACGSCPLTLRVLTDE